LTTGNKVKLSVKFQGRQIQHQEFGHKLVEKFRTDLVEFGTPEGEPKLMGKRLMFTIGPSKKKIQKTNEESK